MSVRGVPEKDPTFPSNPEFPSRIVTEGLVSYWTMDNKDLSGSVPSATVKDIWGDNDGTTSGTITTGATGKINEAFELDGLNDYIKNSSFSQSGEYTILLWVKPSSVDQAVWTGMFSSNVGGGDGTFQIDFDGNGNYRYHGTDSGGYTINYIIGPASTTWDFLAISWNDSRGELKGYLNGDVRFSDNTLSSGDSGSFYNLIAGVNRAENYYFNGIIDEVHIYSRVLSETEIRRNYLATRNKLGRGFPA